MIKKLLSLSQNLFTKTAFLTFAFRSKCRVNKSTSCKKKRENQYSSSSRNKNQEHRNIATLSLQLRSYNNMLFMIIIEAIFLFISWYNIISYLLSFHLFISYLHFDPKILMKLKGTFWSNCHFHNGTFLLSFGGDFPSDWIPKSELESSSGREEIWATAIRTACRMSSRCLKQKYS